MHRPFIMPSCLSTCMPGMACPVQPILPDSRYSYFCPFYFLYFTSLLSALPIDFEGGINQFLGFHASECHFETYTIIRYQYTTLQFLTFCGTNVILQLKQMTYSFIPQ